MPEIRELSKSMINKIAAGEVVERPANVVKELVENSIDAGATKIEISIGKSGSESIKIVDDGCGIAAEQLFLALSPHSTSKISEADDLFRIHTLGFRGEALASIAEVSQLTISSRTADSPEGAKLTSDGGVFGEITPCGRPVGTTIEARNIFFNVPARRKFLKSPTTEFGHISEAVVRLAIPRTGVRFILKHNERVVYDFPAADGQKARIAKIFGADVASRLVPIESEYKNVRVSGFVGLPDLSRGSQSLQYIFLNGRHIRDRALQHALAEAYRGLLVSGRHPVAFLNIETPPDFVDVNVHPSKLEVRFVDGQAIYAGVLSAIRDKFLRSDLTSRPNADELETAVKRSQVETQKSVARQETIRPVELSGAEKAEAPSELPPVPERRFVPDVDSSDPSAALDSGVAASRRDVLDWLGAGKNAKKSGDSGAVPTADSAQAVVDAANDALAEAAFSANDDDSPAPPSVPERSFATPRFSGGSSEFRKFPPLPKSPLADLPTSPNLTPSNEIPPKNAEPVAEIAPQTPNFPEFATPPTAERVLSGDELRERVAANNAGAARQFAGRVAFNSSGKPVVQISERYLVMETKNGLAIVDQHALHERILYEKLKINLENGKLDSQRLLVPAVVDLAPSELPIALENRELFAEMGLLVDAFGGSSVVVNGYPAILRKAAPTEIFLAALGVLQKNRGRLERADLLDASLKQMACKAAIKAGDPLRSDAILELIAAAEEELNSHHCPHGRPSTLVFTCAEIDKLFKRQ